MTRIEQALFALLRSAMQGEPAREDPELSADDWQALLRLSLSQQLLPLVYECAYRLPSFRTLEPAVRQEFRLLSVKIAMRQMVQSNDFLSLYAAAQREGLHALVMKGIVCRQLYPVPCLRPSVDEDLLISADEREAWHRFLTEYGLTADREAADGKLGEEFSYHKPNSPTYLEMHAALFPSDSDAYGDLNELFAGVWDRAASLQVEDVTLSTLDPTDHLLFLLCHAYKHFLHGGVGVRHASDIAMFTRSYAAEIDFQRLYAACERKGIQVFCAGLFAVGSRHLGLEQIPGAFAALSVDEGPLLEDMLSDGMFGSEDPDRMHSSHITLEAVAAGGQGRGRTGIWKSLFPGKEHLQNSYPYARAHPWLLPVAWANRLIRYAAREKGDPGKSLRIGRERVELLRKYKIIP